MTEFENELNVWFENIHVGYLTCNECGYLDFLYSDDWLSHAKKFPISCSLPLTELEYKSDSYQSVANAFFVNLLPEGWNREYVERLYGVPKDNNFLLIKAIGGDCAGALSISEYEPHIDSDYQAIPESELKSLTSHTEYQKYLMDKKIKQRWSLAGAQNKVNVLFDQGHFYLPLGTSPSTHILKFESIRENHATQFETLTTWIAQTVGLKVANIEFQPILASSVTLSERYDRYQRNGVIKRLHQEDFCQALGYPNNKKYQTEGGPDFEKCVSLIRDKSTAAINDINQIIKWQLFNFIVGNSDAHAKNVSFLYDQENRIMLSPFYDFICTQAYPHINSDLAIHIAGSASRSHVGKHRWEQFANNAGVKNTFIIKTLNELSDSIPNAFVSQRRRFEERYGVYHAFDNIEKVIQKNIKIVERGMTIIGTKTPSKGIDTNN